MRSGTIGTDCTPMRLPLSVEQRVEMQMPNPDALVRVFDCLQAHGAQHPAVAPIRDDPRLESIL